MVSCLMITVRPSGLSVCTTPWTTKLRRLVGLEAVAGSRGWTLESQPDTHRKQTANSGEAHLSTGSRFGTGFPVEHRAWKNCRNTGALKIGLRSGSKEKGGVTAPCRHHRSAPIESMAWRDLRIQRRPRLETACQRGGL